VYDARPVTPPYQLAIFDFDGTLADTFPFFTRTHDVIARRHGFAGLDLARLDDYRGLTPRELMKRQGVPMWKLPFIARDFVTLLAASVAEVRLFAGITTALHDLSAAGVRLAIVTSNSLGNVRHVLGPDLTARIEHLETGAGLFGKKRRLERVVKTLRVARGSAIYVGDQTTDADAARDAGLAFGAVHWGYATPALLAGCVPALTFEATADLRRIAAPGS
jgi:phosphoglycolate phosphatase